MLAALPLGSGRPIADPFEPTAEILELLRLRAEQVQASEPNGWRDRVRSLLRARPSHARA